MEEWKTLKRIPHYEISNTGKVRSTRYNKIKMLKQSCTAGGYLLVCLSDGNKKYTSYVHRLVAEVFLPEPGVDQLVVNHKNKIRHDNDVKNLEWATVKENMMHALAFDSHIKFRDLANICYKMDLAQLDEMIRFGNTLITNSDKYLIRN